MRHRIAARDAVPIAVTVVGLALAGCGSAAPQASTTASAHAAEVRTKTVTASSTGHSLPTLIAKARSGIVRIRANGCDATEIGTA